jgi:hypothetical protein
VFTDKGKPAERLGRNATGLMQFHAMTAGLPEQLYKNVQNWDKVIGTGSVLYFANPKIGSPMAFLNWYPSWHLTTAIIRQHVAVLNVF